LRLLESCRGYVMTDNYAGYNALALQPGVQRLACMVHVRRKFVEAQKVQPKGKTVHYLSSNWGRLERYIESGYPSITTPPKERSSRLSLGVRPIPPMAPPPPLKSTAWSRPPRSTAKSPIRGCGTYWSGYSMPRRLKTLKPCCHGTARRKCQGGLLPYLWVGEVYGSLTNHRDRW
jgi:hypothetical protein